jgi:hypothetical protein
MDVSKLVGRLGETRAGKGFTQKRFTEVQALCSDMQRSRVGPTHSTAVTHIISHKHLA